MLGGGCGCGCLLLGAMGKAGVEGDDTIDTRVIGRRSRAESFPCELEGE